MASRAESVGRESALTPTEEERRLLNTPPKLPVHPVLGRESLRGPKKAGIPSVLDVGSALRFVSGRFAFAEALRLSGILRGDEVLLPAYSCPAMVSPVRWFGAEPVFFKVHEDLTYDLEDLEAKMTERTSHVLLVHYFGFPLDPAPLQELCQRRDVTLIEDCAHAFFGSFRGAPLGSFGEFAFASAMKFFPIYDGGCLVSRKEWNGPVVLQRAALRYQLKSAVATLQKAQHYGRLPGAQLVERGLDVARSLRERLTAKRPPSRRSSAPAALDGGYRFEPEWVATEMSIASKQIMKRASLARVVERRRANYRRLAASLESLAGGRPLFPELPDGVVPYVFPYLVDDPARVFPALKGAGVPLLRWDDAETDVCPVSARYSRELLLVPCHQELEENDLAWIHDRLEETLTRGPRTRGKK